MHQILAVLATLFLALVTPWVHGQQVSGQRMRQVYEEVKTPFKYGVVIRGEDRNPVDCPSVFRFEQKWTMICVCMNKVGYETHLAESDDLLNWKTLGKIMSFRKEGWDARQAAGGVALCDPAWGGSSELRMVDGKYWLSYVGGALQGYETDPLSIGMAWTTTPARVHEWTRLPENPVLTREQPDVRKFEQETLYKLASTPSTWPMTTPGSRRARRPAPAGAPKAESIATRWRAAGSVGSSLCSPTARTGSCAPIGAVIPIGRSTS
ncbi:MAG: hypothetical protein NTY19_18320 [Planctomycetota bacterium]|nr:hypothetical protein [Planctomycetota bacterium]